MMKGSVPGAEHPPAKDILLRFLRSTPREPHANPTPSCRSLRLRHRYLADISCIRAEEESFLSDPCSARETGTRIGCHHRDFFILLDMLTTGRLVIERRIGSSETRHSQSGERQTTQAANVHYECTVGILPIVPLSVGPEAWAKRWRCMVAKRTRLATCLPHPEPTSRLPELGKQTFPLSSGAEPDTKAGTNSWKRVRAAGVPPPLRCDCDD